MDLKHVIEPKISLGIILEIAVMVIVVTLAWGNLEANQASLRKEMDAHINELEKIKSDYVRSDVNLAHRKLDDERFNEILRRLERIENRLR